MHRLKQRGKGLRDVEILRSGEEWSPAPLQKIDEADIFQLCWSQTASDSQYVKREWQHALARRVEPLGARATANHLTVAGAWPARAGQHPPVLELEGREEACHGAGCHQERSGRP